MSNVFTIGRHTIGLDHPTYFVADLAANHDGSLERAKGTHPSFGRGRRKRCEVPEFPRSDDCLRSRLPFARLSAIASGGMEEERL